MEIGNCFVLRLVRSPAGHAARTLAGLFLAHPVRANPSQQPAKAIAA